MKTLRGFSIIVALTITVPLVILIVSSFTTSNYIKFPPTGFGVGWYAKAFANTGMRDALWTSLLMVIIVAPVATAMGTMAAFALVRYRIPAKEVITTLLMGPLLLPSVVIGMMLLNYFAAINSSTFFLNLVLGEILLATPYVIRVTLAALQGTDARLEDAAQSLGATPWEAARLVTLPIIRPSLLAATAFAYIVSFNDVSISVFLSRPGNTTLSAFLFNYAEQTSDPLVAAVSGILVVIAVVFLVIIERTLGVKNLLGF